MKNCDHRCEDCIKNNYTYCSVCRDAIDGECSKCNLWIIWSIEHNAWWGDNHTGYFKSREIAGKYSYEEALRIVKGANIGEHDIPNEAMIKFYD